MELGAASRREYEQGVLSAFARLAGRRAPGISDETLGHEQRAQRIFYDALARFRAEVRAADTLTDLRREALAELLAGLDDTTPDRKAWDEAIAEARNG